MYFGIKQLICAVSAILISLIIAYFSYNIIEIKFAKYLKNKWIKTKHESLQLAEARDLQREKIVQK